MPSPAIWHILTFHRRRVEQTAEWGRISPVPMKYLNKLCIVASLLAGSPLYGQITYDFNDSGQPATSFNATGGAAAWAWGAQGGIDNTGWMNPNGAAGSLVATQGFVGSTADFTLSLNFQWTTPTSTSNGNVFYIGIGPSPSYDAPAKNGVATDQHLLGGIGINSTGSPRIIGSSMVNGAYSSFTGNAMTLTAGDWYNLTVQFERTGSTYKMTINVFEADAITGAPGAEAIATLTKSIANSSLASGSVYAFFSARSTAEASGLAGVDNFYVSAISVVPEPASASMMLIGGMGALLSSRLIRRKTRV